MVKRPVMLILLILALSSCASASHNWSSCALDLEPDFRYPPSRGLFENDTAEDIFHDLVHHGAQVVYMDLKFYQSNGNHVAFDKATEDTFAPDVFVWVQNAGRTILRMPFDAGILSLGLIGMRQAHMDVVVRNASKSCLDSLDYDEYIDQVTHFIKYVVNGDSNITLNSQESSTETDLLCRAAYTFHYPPYGHHGVGYKCCFHDNDDDRITCEKSYSGGWAVVWWGPLAFLIFIYVFIIIKLIFILRAARVERRASRALGNQGKLEEARAAMMRRAAAAVAKEQMSVTKAGAGKLKLAATAMRHDTASIKSQARMSELSEKSSQSDRSAINNTFSSLKTEIDSKIAFSSQGVLDRDGLIALHEQVTIFDVIGVTKASQKKMDSSVKIVKVIFYILLYYGVAAYLLYSYSQQQSLYTYTRGSTDMYVNCFGHMGWLFAPEDYWVFTYAICETVITLLLPIFILFIYMCMTLRNPAGEVTPEKQDDPAENTTDAADEVIGHVIDEGLDIAGNAERTEEKPMVENDNGASRGKVGGLPPIKKRTSLIAKESMTSDTHAQFPDPSDDVGTNSNNHNNNQPKLVRESSGNVDADCAKETENKSQPDCCDSCYTCIHTAASGFVNLICVRIFAVMIGIITGLHIVLVLGPLLSYMGFFIALALFSNVETVTPWLLPIGLCVIYAGKVFDPAISFYSTIRDMFFQVAHKMGARELFVRDKETGRMSIPRDLFSSFYDNQGKEYTQKAVTNLVSMMGVTYLMMIVTLAMQYPMFVQSTSTTAHLSMQILFILPLVQRLVSEEAPDAGQLTFLRLAVRKHIKLYLRDTQGGDSGSGGIIKAGGDDDEDVDDDDFDEEFGFVAGRSGGTVARGTHDSGSRFTMMPTAGLGSRK